MTKATWPIKKTRAKRSSGSFGDESKLQDLILKWLEYTLPHIRKRICSIPNSGLRSKAEGARQVQLGLKAGMPDLFMFMSYGGFHGLFIELKWGKNTLTDSQSAVLKDLIDGHYCCAVCYSFEEAQATIKAYISGKGNTVQEKTCQFLKYWPFKEAVS